MEFNLVARALLSLLVVGVLMVGGWRILNWVWLKPIQLEKFLRQQGLQGNSYKRMHGDSKELLTMSKQARSKPMPPSDDDITHYFAPFFHQTIKNYGKGNVRKGKGKMTTEQMAALMRQKKYGGKPNERVINLGQPSTEELAATFLTISHNTPLPASVADADGAKSGPASPPPPMCSKNDIVEEMVTELISTPTTPVGIVEDSPIVEVMQS